MLYFFGEVIFMTKINITYLTDGQTELLHGPTGETVKTDLPPDNGGKGRRFSPTDLFAASFASCVLTIMGKLAERRGETLEGAEIEIDKIMAENPRRVGSFILNIKFPPGFNEEQKKVYLGAVKSCPVHNSLHPDIKVEVNVC